MAGHQPRSSEEAFGLPASTRTCSNCSAQLSSMVLATLGEWHQKGAVALRVDQMGVAVPGLHPIQQECCMAESLICRDEHCACSSNFGGSIWEGGNVCALLGLLGSWRCLPDSEVCQRPCVLAVLESGLGANWVCGFLLSFCPTMHRN